MNLTRRQKIALTLFVVLTAWLIFEPSLRYIFNVLNGSQSQILSPIGEGGPRFARPGQWTSDLSGINLVSFLLVFAAAILPILRCRGILSTIILIPSIGLSIYLILSTALEFFHLIPKSFFPAIFLLPYLLLPLGVGILAELYYRKRHKAT